MTRVLITGADGLLGRSLSPHLLECEYEVFLQGRKKHVGICADLSNADEAKSALDQVMPDVIVNLAAFTDVDECERSPQHAYLSNIRIVENLAMWIQKNSNRVHLIHISTDQVYDGKGPHKEDDITLTNYYGFSKYAGELAAVTVPSTILRTNFFGPSKCPGRMSLSDWLVKSLTKSESITVFDDICFSPLAIQCLVEMIELVIVKRRQGIFNLGSKDGMSKADFAFTLAKTLGLSSQTMSRGTSDKLKFIAYRPKDMTMDSSYFKEAFDVDLPTLEDEIQSMKESYAYETK